jgi:endonuclease/exonuclease/phosphatase family metal-dependent hydrolase
MTKLRIISWNIALKGLVTVKVDYLKSVINESNCNTIVALQEVMEKDKDYLITQDIFSSYSYSLDFRSPGPFDTSSRKLGCLIGIAGSMTMHNSGVIERTPFPDRTLYTDINVDNFLFKAICFHALTGVGYKKAKTAQFVGIAEYLHLNRDVPTICCFDANEPEIDHHDINHTKFFNQNGDKGMGAALILGSTPVHSMKDSYREWLEVNQSVLDDIKVRQVQADDEKVLKGIPLATSHIINGRLHKRYDYIHISNHFRVVNVEYRLEESLQAGSDHAMVVTDLILN